MPYPQVGRLTPPPDQRRRLDTYTRGFSDALGDRLLTFDAGTATSLELLRFKPEFGGSAPFEAALRDRVEHTHVQDPAIAPARAVERVEGSLLLVSRHVAGRRLSDLLPEKHGPMVALECIRQLVPLLAALAEASHRFAHGALTMDRVIASHDGRLTIVEHPLGAAVEALEWSAARLQSELGLVVPTDGSAPQFDGRIDVIQLGAIALSLLLGRSVDPAEYPTNVPKLLAESAEVRGGETWAASRLRSWLERALQIGARPLESAREALMTLGELPRDAELRRQDPAAAASSPQAPSPKVQAPAAKPATSPKATVPTKPAGSPAPAPAPASSAPAPTNRPTPEPAPDPAESRVAPAPVAPRRSRTRRWVLAAVFVLALAEGVVIVAQRYFTPKPIVVEVAQPAPPVVADPPPAVIVESEPSNAGAPAPTDAASTPQRPQSPTPTAGTPAGHPSAATALGTLAPAPTPASAPDRSATAASRIGGLTFVSPIELQVFEGGRRIGSSGVSIAMPDGAHTVELVNEALGLRVQQTITVKAGDLASRVVPLPNGKLSVNASPWADVWIDGSPAGQTPLANLTLPVGEHQVVLRHPQFGEQRHTAVVRFDGVTRVSANMQQR